MKATIKLSIETEINIADAGYLGTLDSSVQEHIDAAVARVNNYTVFIKKHPTDAAQMVPSKITLKEVVLTP